MKVNVVSIGLDDINKDLSNQIQKNHRVYSANHGYNYLRTKNLLVDIFDKETDYSLVINDLCLFLNTSLSIDKFLNENDHIYFPLYLPSKTYSIIDNYICSDVFIAKNTTWTKEILYDWFNSKSSISEFIEKNVDISTSCDIQNIGILDGSFRIGAAFFDKNPGIGRKSMILNMSNLSIENMIKTINDYNSYIGVL